MEAPAIADLPGGPLPYTLRHSPRARSVRVVIHPDRGVVVTLPATRSATRDGERHATAFLAEREAWLRRHLDRQAQVDATLASRGGAKDGGVVPFRGRLHRVRVVPGGVRDPPVGRHRVRRRARYPPRRRGPAN